VLSNAALKAATCSLGASTMELTIDYKEILEIERQIADLKSLHMRLPFYRLLTKKSLTTNIKKLNNQHTIRYSDFDKKVEQYLLDTESKYSSFKLENKDLLTKNKYLLKVYMTDSDPTATTEKEFKGGISNKGFLYLFVQQTNFIPTGNTGMGLMSKSFKGNFNEIGDFNVWAVDSEYHFFASKIPEFFNGVAYKDNTFQMTAGETHMDFSGHEFVDRIIADPFNENHHDRIIFLKNRNELINIKTDFIKKLKSAST